MPKSQLALVQFHGGVQDALDQRDIPEEALAECTNASITKLGAIRTMSRSSFVAPRPTSLADEFTAGYGYYIYGADYDFTVSVTAQSIADYTDTPDDGNNYNAFPAAGGNGDFVQVNVSAGHGLSVGDKITISGTTANYNGTPEAAGTNHYYDTHTGHTHFTVLYIVSTTAFVMNATYGGATTTTTITVTRNNSGQFTHRLLQNASAFHVIVEDKLNGGLSVNENIIDLGTNDSNVYPSFHKAKGAVRICDGNFDNTANDAKWFGYIPTKYYAYGDNEAANVCFTLTAGWYSEDMFLVGGGSGQTGTITGAAAINVDNSITTGVVFVWNQDDDEDDENIAATLLGDDSDGVVWSLDEDTTEGEFHGDADGDDHRMLLFGHSWVYDGFQETPPVVIQNTGGVDWIATGLDTDESLRVKCYIKMVNNDGVTLNLPSKRITGVRLYIMGTGSVEGVDGTMYDDPLLLAEVDVTKGIRSHSGSFVDYDATLKYGLGWDESQLDGDTDDESTTTTNWASTKSLVIPDHPNISFRMLTGYSHKVASTNAKYKTSCVVDGRVYIGNIEQDIHGDGVVETFEDRVLVCAVGEKGPMPDVFPNDRILEITSNDGDQIVKLISHKGKIVQLNRAKAIVINVYGPNDLETVESTWEGAGITHPSAAVSFNGGITWANKNGCYLYNGEAVLNLIDNKLDLETWRNFILSGVGEHCSIGYCDKDKTITVSNNSNNTYTFGILTQSWMEGVNLIPSGTKSNYITSSDGELEYVATTGFGVSETIYHQTITSHVLGEFATAGIYFNKWDGTGDISNEFLEMYNGTWRPMSENQIVFNGTATDDEEKLAAIADSIKAAVNALADGTYAFNAETSFIETMGPMIFIQAVTLTARNRGTVQNATLANAAGTADTVLAGFRFDTSTNANGLQMILAPGLGGTLTNFSILFEPKGGVAPVAQRDILSINRDGETAAADNYKVSFSVVNPVTGNIAVPVDVEYVTESSDEEEEVVD